MRHLRLERQLSAYLDDELDAEEAGEIRLHLAQCAACQAELERLRAVKHLLAALPERELPPDLWGAVRQKLEQPAQPVWRRWIGALRTLIPRPVAAAAAFAIVLALVGIPLVRGRLDRLRAAETGVDVYAREHALVSAEDPFVDRAYLGLVIGDANRVLVGEPRRTREER